MSSEGTKIDFSGGMFVLGVFVLIILFIGEPDLHDALIQHLMGSDTVCETAATETTS